MITFGIIGSGNIGSAMAKAISAKIGSDKIAVCDADAVKASALAKEIGCECADLGTVTANAEFILLAVKPQSLKSLLADMSASLRSRTKRFILVTPAAGTAIATIEEYLGFPCPVIRIMPNVACAVGAAMTLCCSNDAVTKEDIDKFLDAAELSGAIDLVEESKIDSYSIVTGCGPAYVYLMIEALADGAVSIGVPRDKAYLYAAKMAEGSAKLMLETGRNPAALKDSVCSPAGTTIEGVKALEEGAFRHSLIDAVNASYKRTLELKNGK